MISRRQWLTGSAAALAASPAAQTAVEKNIAIASSNGGRACARAVELLQAGEDTLTAAIAGVNINEEDPSDSSVGYGGLPNEEGVVELDSCVMHGPSRRCGSVASLRGIKTPSKVARVVMEQTDHIMMVGEGALRFAKLHGFREEELLTERGRIAWLKWRQSLSDPRGRNNWREGIDAPTGKPSAALHADEATLAWAREVAENPPTGTINCLTLNRKGEMSGVTTTSGLAWKIAGRVGDSPIIGAGLFVDQDVGSAGSTGRGEENIRVAGAHTVVENMRHGMSPKDAVLDCLERIARNYGNNRDRLAKFSIKFYALRKDGAYAGGSLWNGRERNGKLRRDTFAVNEGAGSRLEDCVYLLER
ncbi:MAG: N(4)-(beta-N-acetylglucosaminyl)-L-asparaginase [bacterium]|nr:N(4)-(beta-N-acetylglucosaminyl)-L-asparaginase [bacterium]